MKSSEFKEHWGQLTNMYENNFLTQTDEIKRK